tara:strand:- start:2525 stop:2713 length:189 start_codon:yes stop_codon:yes gene_type:complete
LPTAAKSKQKIPLEDKALHLIVGETESRVKHKKKKKMKKIGSTENSLSGSATAFPQLKFQFG